MATNALIHETSPYLLQHAHNPVDWHAWNDQVLQAAVAADRMLLISIGYAACHWCHVMEHECFEDPAVAEIMNRYFVCIKVDREERPDVDQVYMNAAYLINGSGGWPLNALALPDGRPFFAGTYFPRQRWLEVLQYFAGLYAHERDKLEQQAALVTRGIREIECVPKSSARPEFSAQDLQEASAALLRRVDFERGGTQSTIKFPMPSIWQFLLQHYYYTGNTEAARAVNTTLRAMADGGIYDHIGGGFSRYSTDPRWHVPHFEKMLYDNAQLLSLYSRAFQVDRQERYREVVAETVAFAERTWRSTRGMFYASLDADSEGDEGKYYCWTRAEIQDILEEDASLFCDVFHITTEGNWEHGLNIPYRSSVSEIPGKNREREAEDPVIRRSKARLLAARDQRVPPGTDDKILTCWNMLMVTGLADAYRAFGEPEYLSLAITCMEESLAGVFSADGSLYRNFKGDVARIQGFLDDYAFSISALISIYQVTFREPYLRRARDLAEYVLQHFFDADSGMFFYTGDEHGMLIARKMELADNVISSSNSEMARNLYDLSVYFEDERYRQLSAQMVINVLEDIHKTPSYYSNWAMALARHAYPSCEIVVTGSGWREELASLQRHYHPGILFAGGEPSDLPLLKDKPPGSETRIYLCRNRTCGLPVATAGEALAQLATLINASPL